jgi:hypothetical protein
VGARLHLRGRRTPSVGFSRRSTPARASTGELVKLELGEIDFEWLADFATRALREIYGDV